MIHPLTKVSNKYKIQIQIKTYKVPVTMKSATGASINWLCHLSTHSHSDVMMLQISAIWPDCVCHHSPHREISCAVRYALTSVDCVVWIAAGVHIPACQVHIHIMLLDCVGRHISRVPDFLMTHLLYTVLSFGIVRTSDISCMPVIPMYN